MLGCKFDEKGREIPDPRPMAIPAGWDRPETLQDQIKRLIRVQLSQQAADTGQETFEEADDFDVPDDEPDLLSGYEVREMASEPLGGVDADGPGGSSAPPVPEAPAPSTAVAGASADVPPPASA